MSRPPAAVRSTAPGRRPLEDPGAVVLVVGWAPRSAGVKRGAAAAAPPGSRTAGTDGCGTRRAPAAGTPSAAGRAAPGRGRHVSLPGREGRARPPALLRPCRGPCRSSPPGGRGVNDGPVRRRPGAGGGGGYGSEPGDAWLRAGGRRRRRRHVVGRRPAGGRRLVGRLRARLACGGLTGGLRTRWRGVNRGWPAPAARRHRDTAGRGALSACSSGTSSIGRLVGTAAVAWRRRRRLRRNRQAGVSTSTPSAPTMMTSIGRPNRVTSTLSGCAVQAQRRPVLCQQL